MPLEISDALLKQLRQDQASRTPWDPSLESPDVFLLDPGLGPATCLTADGRVLIDGRGWDDTPLRETQDPSELYPAIVVGAKKTGIPDLLELLPTAPATAVGCARCSGTRWMDFAGAKVVCSDCHGLGWKDGDDAV